MIREEAIAFGKRVIDLGFNGDTKEFCELAINALEQEPCGDCISREKALQIIRAWFDREATPSDLKNEIEQLPPVTPQPKMGRWIDEKDGYGTGCSECGKWYSHSIITKQEVLFCSSCGAKMQEVEE